MTLGDKLRYLREVEGVLRGLGREMTQQEVVRAIKRELKQNISQSYLSQIESGARPHLTENTRMLLADFFKVHPGYLVNDPDQPQAEPGLGAKLAEDTLDLWLVSGAERFQTDPEVAAALVKIARHEDSRKCLALLGSITEVPGLVDRLLTVLKPDREEQEQETLEVG
jgi:transcriptional regulator with XRE-family HTH domain